MIVSEAVSKNQLKALLSNSFQSFAQKFKINKGLRVKMWRRLWIFSNSSTAKRSLKYWSVNLKRKIWCSMSSKISHFSTAGPMELHRKISLNRSLSYKFWLWSWMSFSFILTNSAGLLGINLKCWLTDLLMDNIQGPKNIISPLSKYRQIKN